MIILDSVTDVESNTKSINYYVLKQTTVGCMGAMQIIWMWCYYYSVVGWACLLSYSIPPSLPSLCWMDPHPPHRDRLWVCVPSAATHRETPQQNHTATLPDTRDPTEENTRRLRVFFVPPSEFGKDQPAYRAGRNVYRKKTEIKREK